MSKNVSIIPARNINIINGEPLADKKRVCAYCRVSTDSEEQQTSYDTQIQYYEKYIKQRADWEFAGIYADEGITGTNTKNRVEFIKMIADCEAGEIDMIITKSISRFARNTLDCLKYVRTLKEKGIGVFFEKENINTLDGKGEVLLTILSSLAQDESRNISENSRWGIVRRFQQGKVRVNHNRFLGYDKDSNGNLVVNQEQAKVVKRIFHEYLKGKSFNSISKALEKDGVLTGAGKKKWWTSTIQKILKNEKYYGDAILQKTYTLDFLTHKKVKNKGQVQQFYVEGSHEPIISKEIYDKVQAEIARRAEMNNNIEGNREKYSNKYCFSGKVKCGCCGSNYTRRVWNSIDKYKKYIWGCSNRFRNGSGVCGMDSVPEQRIKDAFVKAFNKAFSNKEMFLSRLNKNIQKVIDTKNDIEVIAKIDMKIEELKEELKRLVHINTKSSIDSEIYNDEYFRIASDLEECRKKKMHYSNNILRKTDIQVKTESIKEILKLRKDILTEFDEELFIDVVDSVVIKSPVQIEFILSSGIKLEEIG